MLSDKFRGDMVRFKFCQFCWHEVKKKIDLRKEVFNKKRDLMRGSPSLHLKKRKVKAFV